MSDTAPAGVTYGELPAFVTVDGAKGIERVLKTRLDDALSTELLYDRDTRTLSNPGESVEAFARRVQDTPALREDRRALERKLADKRGELSQRQQEAKSRGFEKWASLGTSLLSNIGLFTGRKRTVTGVSGVLSKQRMENTARSRIERIEDDVAELEQQLEALSQLDYQPLRTPHREADDRRRVTDPLRDSLDQLAEVSKLPRRQRCMDYGAPAAVAVSEEEPAPKPHCQIVSPGHL